MPGSSRTSRRTASSSVSPGSTKPARHEKRAPGRRRLRPSRARSPRTASMITTGSVRGKCDARHSGQRRTQPADVTRVGEPHCAQKRCRACQSSSERASARIAASPAGIVGARARTSISSVSMSGAALAPLASIAKCARPSSRGRERSAWRPPRSARATGPPAASRAPASPAPRTNGFRSRSGRIRVAGSAEQRGDPLRVVPALADAVERVAGEAIDVFHMGRDYTASWLA